MPKLFADLYYLQICININYYSNNIIISIRKTYRSTLSSSLDFVRQY